MTLHIVASSPFQSAALDNCLEVIQSDDILVLLADAVYATACDHLIPRLLACYYIREDVMQRGITPASGCLPLDYAQLVSLTELNSAIHTWR